MFLSGSCNHRSKWWSSLVLSELVELGSVCSRALFHPLFSANIQEQLETLSQSDGRCSEIRAAQLASS